MLRSKATAALMKLKEIDRKYKNKLNADEVKTLESDTSDISFTIDSSKEDSKKIGEYTGYGSGDVEQDTIITLKIKRKLDIRMPDASMERVAVVKENETELVTIFNKQKKHSPKLDGDISSDVVITLVDDETVKKKAEEEISFDNEKNYAASNKQLLQSSLEKSSPTIISEENSVSIRGTSISEDVPELFSSSLVTRTINNSRELINVENINSILDLGEKFVRSEEDSLTLIASASGVYSEDFVKTSSEESKESSEIRDEKSTSSESKHVSNSPTNYCEPRRLPKRGKDIVELIPAQVLRTFSECDVNLDSGLKNYMKKIDESINSDDESPVRLLRQPSQSSNSRSGKKHRRNRRPSGVSSSCRDSQAPNSPESSSSSAGKRKPKGSSNVSKSPESNHKGKTDPEVSIIFSRKREKDSKDEETVSFLEAGTLSKLDNEEIRRDKKCENFSSKQGKQIRAKDSSTNEPPPVPVRPAGSEFIKLSNDDQVVRSAQRVRKVAKRSAADKRKAGKSVCKEGSKGDEDRGVREEESPAGQNVTELRLQQERDRLRARVKFYIRQMIEEKRRLSTSDDDELGIPIYRDNRIPNEASGLRGNKNLRSFFKPLDLPNVAAFERPDFRDELSTFDTDLDNEGYLQSRIVRERVLGIRHWLRQQFILYRNYCSLVSTINAKYIPVTLKETKKMIRDIRQFQNNREWSSRHVR